MKEIVFNRLGSFILFSLVVFFSCKKETTDLTPPAISIYAPYQNQSYNYTDTIRTDFSVSDDFAVNSIGVTVVDANIIPVLPSLTVTPLGRLGTYHQSIVIDNIHLATGSYFLKITASDGQNTGEKFQPITILGAPKKRLSYFYVTKPAPNSVQVNSLDTNFVSGNYYSVYGDLIASEINSYNQNICTEGSQTGNLNTIRLSSPSLAWSVPVVNSSSPYFEGLSCWNNMTYVSFYTSVIKGYDENGNQRFNATVANGFYPIKILRHDIYLAAEAKDISSSAKKIILYYLGSGLGAQENALNMDVVSMFTYDAGNIFLFGNSGGQGVFSVYQIATNSFVSPVNIPAGSILSAVQVDNDNYLIAHSNGTIYKFQYSGNSLTVFASGVIAAHMAYDDVNHELLVSQSNSIKKYNYTNSALLNSIPTTDSVCGLHVLFNK